MGATKEIYWHLPGFCYFRLLNQVWINLMRDYPERFRAGYRIGSVYGTFPGAIWNGGRAVFGIASKTDIQKILQAYNSKGVPVRFTWTNSLLEEKHLSDTYCNLIMRLADNGLNQVLANTPVLEQYLRKEYPGFKVISSTTKRMLDPGILEQELSRDYFLVVLDYDLNHNEEVLKRIEPYAGKVEILVDEICQPGCKMREFHYREESRIQLEYDRDSRFQCPTSLPGKSFAECQKRPAFLSNTEIASYAERGFVNFKLVGRGLPEELVKESYLYYMVRDEEREFIRSRLEKTLADLRGAAPGGRPVSVSAAPGGQTAHGGGVSGGRPATPGTSRFGMDGFASGYRPMGGKKK